MAAKTKFRGSFTALVTPFKNGSLDEAAFRGLVNWQIAEGTHGLVPVGTTGESPTVSHDEHKRVVEWCIDEAARSRSRDRRRRFEFDPGGDRTGRACGEGGGGRGSRGDALLQQADPGGHVPALQGDQRCDRHSDHHLQYSAAFGGRHERGYHGAPVRTQEHRRRQGRHRQHGAGLAAACAAWRGFQPAIGRGRHRARLYGPWRPWLYFGDLQRRAAPVFRISSGLAERAITPPRSSCTTS